MKDLYIFFAFSAVLMEGLGKTMIMFVRVVLIVPGFRTMYLQSKSVVCYHYLHKSLVVTSKVIYLAD
jgi:hypothetical protein